MSEQCPYNCTNKTEFGYCKNTVCINPAYQNKWYWAWNFTPEMVQNPCQYCPNNPKNGGTGICHCILGTPTIY